MRRSFKDTLNAAARTGLTAKPTPSKAPPFRVDAKHLGLRPGIDPIHLNKLADELETEAVIGKIGSRSAKKAKVNVPDVNLLLYAYDTDSPFHRKSASWWQSSLSGTEPVGLPDVVVFAFLRMITNPRVFRDPMTPVEAIARVRSWFAQPVVRRLDSDSFHVERVMKHLETLGTAANLVTDAQIAALAVENNAVLHTSDSDFTRFTGFRWFNPITGVGNANPRRRPSSKKRPTR